MRSWPPIIKVYARNSPAFSLVEVVIALGLTSFALLSMVGLLAIGLQNNRESTEETNLALCTETALSILRSRGFNLAASDVSYKETDSTPDFYFDGTGNLVVDANGLPAKTQSPDALYACTVTRATPTLDQPTTKLIYLRLQFHWPLAAPAAARQHRIVITSLANYE